MMTPEERALDSYLSWSLGVEIWRERLIRSGDFPPRPDHPEEMRWATEGERDAPRLDTVLRTPASILPFPGCSPAGFTLDPAGEFQAAESHRMAEVIPINYGDLPFRD